MDTAMRAQAELLLMIQQRVIGEGPEKRSKGECRTWTRVVLRSLSGTCPIGRSFLFGAALSTVLAGCHLGHPPAPQEPSPRASERISVGYHTRAPEEITAAVSSVLREELDEQRVQSIEQILRQRIPGVRVRYLPSGEVSFQIRGPGSFTGSTDPLVVIDGRPTQIRELFQLSPLEVGRIDVLRDGAAAIYGMRGANGVILVSTRRGR